MPPDSSEQRAVRQQGKIGSGRRAEAAAPIAIPASAMRYLSLELAEALGVLSQQQVDAIFRIVESGHLVDDPPAPYVLIRGENPICSESVWKRSGKQGKNGRWIQRPGWSHQAEFLRALKMAKRLLRQQVLSAELAGGALAASMVQRRLPDAMRRMIELSTGYQLRADGELMLDAQNRPILLTVDERTQVQAGKVVLEIGLKRYDAALVEGDVTGDAARMWWEAAEEEGGMGNGQ